MTSLGLQGDSVEGFSFLAGIGSKMQNLILAFPTLNDNIFCSHVAGSAIRAIIVTK